MRADTLDPEPPPLQNAPRPRYPPLQSTADESRESSTVNRDEKLSVVIHQSSAGAKNRQLMTGDRRLVLTIQGSAPPGTNLAPAGSP